MRKKIVAGNWKMNKTHQEGMELLMDLFNLIEIEENLLEETGKKLPEIVIAPPYILLSDACGFLQAWETKVAAQNCSTESKGSYTGEISAAMLRSINVDYVILGHSERRIHFNETDEAVAKKINRALEQKLSVICCIGETLQEREARKEFETVTHQMEKCLFHLSEEQMKNIVIAYEPVWAIGTGKNATPGQAQEMHRHIRSVIAGKYGNETAENISILYGGSCNPSNAKAIFSQPDVDGGLIGAASLNSRDFLEVIKAA
ncbi:MAG TPA: triose-phosphate isomerase, partial [Bacteroidia bacterium]